jgi:hypothetical protein
MTSILIRSSPRRSALPVGFVSASPPDGLKPKMPEVLPLERAFRPGKAPQAMATRGLFGHRGGGFHLGSIAADFRHRDWRAVNGQRRIVRVFAAAVVVAAALRRRWGRTARCVLPQDEQPLHDRPCRRASRARFSRLACPPHPHDEDVPQLSHPPQPCSLAAAVHVDGVAAVRFAHTRPRDDRRRRRVVAGPRRVT